MSELLGALAFTLLVGGQFLAVVAVHRLRQDALAGSTDVLQTPGLRERDQYVLAERLTPAHGEM